MATKRRQCEMCWTHTIVRKAKFASKNPDREFDLVWLCSPCIDELGPDDK
jgi:hypothetical protein